MRFCNYYIILLLEGDEEIETDLKKPDLKKVIKSKFRNPTVSTLAKNEVEKIFNLDEEQILKRFIINFE